MRTPIKAGADFPWEGVNLGGWLVLERWITPSLFAGSAAVDELGFCAEPDAGGKLEEHRRSYIAAADFAWIAAQGLNAVRIPVGYWLFGDQPPYKGTVAHLDRAFAEAAQAGLGVVIDLHGAPGSQNGWDHSGKLGEIGWHTDPAAIALTLEVIERLARRYADRSNLLGIELLNEPHPSIPLETVAGYYREGYRRVRRFCGPEVAVIIHDGFQPFAWQDFLAEPHWKNVVLDTHLYQCFLEDDKRLDLAGHLRKTEQEWGLPIAEAARRFKVMVGEWSLALDAQSLPGLAGGEYDAAMQAYAVSQRAAFAPAAGRFFWTYKTENMPAWSLRAAVARGWLRRA